MGGGMRLRGRPDPAQRVLAGAAAGVLAVWPPAGESSIAGARLAVTRPLALLVAGVPVLGVTVFSCYLQLRFGDALAWLHGQAAWGVPLMLRAGAPDPGKLPGEPAIKPIEVIAWIGNIAAFIAAVCAIRPISRRLGPAYGAWIAVNIFPPVAAHLFMSLGRFTSVLFPVFFWMAIRIPRERLMRVALAFAACQAVLATWFFLWRPVV